MFKNQKYIQALIFNLHDYINRPDTQKNEPEIVKLEEKIRKAENDGYQILDLRNIGKIDGLNLVNPIFSVSAKTPITYCGDVVYAKSVFLLVKILGKDKNGDTVYKDSEENDFVVKKEEDKTTGLPKYQIYPPEWI